jgi:hypothetical protein
MMLCVKLANYLAISLALIPLEMPDSGGVASALIRDALAFGTIV